MTLDEFLADQQPVRNQWVEHPDFTGLYVRKGRIIFFLEGELRDKEHDVPKCIQIANVNVKRPGEGCFTRLVEYLRKQYPEHVIYVENALEERFRRYLVKLGFVPIRIPECYVMNFEQYTQES